MFGLTQATAALSRQGRDKTITDNMQIKEVHLAEARPHKPADPRTAVTRRAAA